MISLKLAAGLLAFFSLLSGCAGLLGEPADVLDAAPTTGQSEGNRPQLVGYKSTPRRQLFLHVFTPDSAAFSGPRPAIILFHGGGWMGGDAEQFYDQARHFASEGMVAISAEYRIGSTDGSGPCEALSDAISAMRFVRAHADTLNIDQDRIAAGGGSAGGQLAAALATTESFDDPNDETDLSYRPESLVLLNPVIDNGPGGYGYERVSGYWQAFSPIHNIKAGHPPTIIMLGTRDDLIPVATVESYCDKVRAVGSECRLELYEGQPHGFFNRRRSDLYYGKTIEAIDAFLNSLGYLAARGL